MSITRKGRWAYRVVDNPKLSIVLSLLLCAIFMVGLQGFTFSASPREYQGLDNPKVIDLIRLEQEYSRANNILVMFTTAEESVFTRETLQTLKQFTDDAWQLPHVQRVNSITNFQYSHAQEDELIVEDLVAEPEVLTSQALENIRTVAFSEPHLLGYLLSADARSTAININFNIGLEDVEAIQSIEAEVDRLISEALQSSPQLKAYESGYVAVGLGWLHALQFDLKYLFTSALGTIFIGLWIFFRSIRASCAALSIGILSMFAAAGLVGFFGVNLQPPNAIGFLLILILALVDSIHVVKTARLLQGEGKSKSDAIAESLVMNLRPIFITSLTTAIGFLAFIGGAFAGFRVMGMYIGFGVMLACLLSLTLLPALLLYCPIKPDRSRNAALNINGLADRVVRLRWFFVALTIPAILVSGVIIFNTPLNDNVIHYMQKSQQFRKDLVVIENNLTGSIEIQIELDSGEPEGVGNPAFMKEVEAFTVWLRSQPEIRYVSSYTDTMKRLNQNMRGDDPAAYRLPEEKDLAAQYLLLYELSLPYGLDLTNQINLDKSATRVMMTVNDIPAVELVAISGKIQRWLSENAPHISASEPSGEIMTTTAMSLDTVSAMFYATLSALVVIGGILLFTFRSIVPGILCVIMIVAPLAVAFGIWSLAVGFFDAAATIALCMVVGIVVDSAVHFISKFQIATREMGMTARDAVRYVFNTVGSALVTNSLVLSGGFAILFFSAFKINATMGMLTVLSLLIGLVATFTLLPGLLVLCDRGGRRDAPRQSILPV